MNKRRLLGRSSGLLTLALALTACTLGPAAPDVPTLAPTVTEQAQQAATAIAAHEPTPAPTLVSFVNVPEDVRAWDTYTPEAAGLAIPLPPEWHLTEWPLPDDPAASPFTSSASVRPPEFSDPETCGYQCPEIDIAVLRDPVTTTLRDWLAARSTTDPYGATVDDPHIQYFAIEDVVEAEAGDLPALGFFHTAQGVRIYTLLVARGDTVTALSMTHVGVVDFWPIFELMVAHIDPL